MVRRYLFSGKEAYMATNTTPNASVVRDFVILDFTGGLENARAELVLMIDKGLIGEMLKRRCN